MLELGDPISFFDPTQNHRGAIYMVKKKLWISFLLYLFFLSHIYLYEISRIYIVVAWYSLILYQFFDIVDYSFPLPMFFSFRVFHINLYVFLFFSCCLFSFFHNKRALEQGLISERFDILNNGNNEIWYSAFRLQHQIFAMVG